MAFFSQSGAICTAILDLSIAENIGFSYFVSLGGMLDVDFGDTIDYLGGEPEVSSIVMYVESLTHFRKFMSAARAVSRVKPIITLKAGRTRAGALAAASHTGALAGEDAVYDAAFQRAGIPTFDTPERAVRAFMDIYRYSLNIEMLEQIPSRLQRRLEFDRQEAKAIVQAGLVTENQLLTEMESKGAVICLWNSD